MFPRSEWSGRAGLVTALQDGRMIRKLKTFVTSLGFFDQAIAAPSMKAALEAWGADSNLFHQGAAKQTEDPDIVAATMAAPGIVLKRPVGSSAPFREHADLPTDIGNSRRPSRASVKAAKGRSPRSPTGAADPAAERKAALAFDKEEKRREREQAKEEAARQKERERRQQAIEKAQRALDQARRKHEDGAADIRTEIQMLEDRLRDEEAKWERERTRLEAVLRRARG
jgi:hypothetical protein